MNEWMIILFGENYVEIGVPIPCDKFMEKYQNWISFVIQFAKCCALTSHMRVSINSTIRWISVPLNMSKLNTWINHLLMMSPYSMLSILLWFFVNSLDVTNEFIINKFRQNWNFLHFLSAFYSHSHARNRFDEIIIKWIIPSKEGISIYWPKSNENRQHPCDAIGEGKELWACEQWWPTMPFPSTNEFRYTRQTINYT